MRVVQVIAFFFQNICDRMNRTNYDSFTHGRSGATLSHIIPWIPPFPLHFPYPFSIYFIYFLALAWNVTYTLQRINATTTHAEWKANTTDKLSGKMAECFDIINRPHRCLSPSGPGFNTQSSQFIGLVFFPRLFLTWDYLFGIVVSTSDCHPRGPGFDSRLYPRNFSRSIGSGTGSTQARGANWVAAWYEK